MSDWDRTVWAAWRRIWGVASALVNHLAREVAQ